LDVFYDGGAGGIGGRQINDLRSLAQEYRHSGEGPLMIATPANDPASNRLVPSIRRALAEGGVPSPVAATYAPADPAAIAPIKVTFVRLKADVATRCGRWPSDLSGIHRFEGLQNAPWENFGCAYQSAFAQQVADPLDLVRSRPEGAPNATRRAGVVAKYAKG